MLGGSIFFEPVLVFLALLLACVWWLDKRRTYGTMATSAVASGWVALLVTFATLRWLWLTLFVSLSGVILAAVIAHAVGTAVAMTLDLRAGARTVQQVSRRVTVAAVCGVVLWFAISALHTSFSHAAPSLYREYGGVEAILTVTIGYAVCALVARRIEPSWTRYAAPLAIAAVVVTCVTLLTMIYDPPPTYWYGPAATGPMPPSPMPPK